MLVSNLSRLRPMRLGWLVVLCAIVALLVAMATPSRADAARVRCAGTFRVLHDDHVGRLSLPQGNYTITILASGTPGCAQASTLFTRFLEDYDGKLPGGWRRHPVGGAFCPAPFWVLHNDHIGSLPVAKGDYWIILLQRTGLSCSRAETLLVRFLESPGGELPPPWLLESQTASFLRSASGPGFRIKPAIA